MLCNFLIVVSNQELLCVQLQPLRMPTKNVKINISEKVIHTISRNRGQKYKGMKQIKLLLTNQLLLLLLLHGDILAVSIEQLLCFACYNPRRASSSFNSRWPSLLQQQSHRGRAIVGVEFSEDAGREPRRSPPASTLTPHG